MIIFGEQELTFSKENHIQLDLQLLLSHEYTSTVSLEVPHTLPASPETSFGGILVLTIVSLSAAIVISVMATTPNTISCSFWLS